MRLTDEQRRAIESVDRNVCVDAGAGSGKTRVLVGRILHLLEHNLADLDEIVAITFTEKAASEMKARLRQACHERAPVDDPGAMTRWRTLERRIDTARISTIHAFCMAILKQNALTIGWDPDFTILSEADDFLLRDEVITSTVHALLESAQTPEAKPPAQAAARLAEEHRVSGLCEMLHRLMKQCGTVDHIARNLPVNDPTALEAKWDSWVEEESRRNLVKLRQSDEFTELYQALSSLEGYCTDPADDREQVRRELLRIVATALQATDDRSGWKALLSVRDIKLSRASKKAWQPPEAADDVKAIRDALRDLVEECAPPEKMPEIERRSAQLSCDLMAVCREADGKFQEAKAARIGRTFDDLILETVRLLRENDAVRAHVARGIQHLLIDEFQDTDSRQLEIAELLTAEQGGPRLFIVGDAKQSIYRFRGAEVEVFEEARGRAEECIRLDRNFRSAPEVLRFVNTVFRESNLLADVEPAYAELAHDRAAVAGCRVEFLLPEVADHANADEVREAEAELIARRIAAMCAGPERVEVFDPNMESNRPAKFGDVALLFRSMRDVYIYEKPFKELGMPYSVVAGAGFFERQEVTDLRNVLQIVVEPSDEMAMLGVLRSPIIGMSDNGLAALCAERQGSISPLTSLESADPSFSEASQLAEARTLVDDLRARREMPLAAFLRYVLRRTNYEAILLGQEYLGVQKALNVRKVVELAEGFSRTRLPRLAAFVRYLDEVANEEIREGEAALQPEGARSVTLMTIHKAKGLEFPIVVLPDLARKPEKPRDAPFVIDSKYGPAVKVTDATGGRASCRIAACIERKAARLDLAERARILYVAMTRARDWLLLCGASGKSPQKHTWLRTFNDLFGLPAHKDGDIISRDGWRAVVRRKVEKTKPDSAGGETKPTLPRKILEARIAPVKPVASTRRTFAVTDLSDIMSGVQPHAHAESDDTDLRRAPALLRGTVAHRMLQLWDFGSDELPDVESIVTRECRDGRYRDELVATLREMAERFTRSPLFKRLHKSASILREKPFLLRVDDALVSGAIDAILEDGTIIDFKTGRHIPERHASYEWQIRLYAAATRQLLGTPPPEAHLCYLDADIERDMVCDVDVSPARIDEAIARIRDVIRRLRETRIRGTGSMEVG